VAISKGYRQLMAEASRKIRTVGLEAAKSKHADAGVVFVDIRDIRELEREGMIPGALHAPRGMLEFWVDPESPYYREIFGAEREFLLYCQSGWRSTLAAATLGEMGLSNVGHLEGGFDAWRAAGQPIAPKARR
jgi:rhodanese-related sulfurtransferase